MTFRDWPCHAAVELATRAGADPMALQKYIDDFTTEDSCDAIRPDAATEAWQARADSLSASRP